MSDMDGAKNVALVQDLVGKYMAGDAAGYIAGCHDDFKGDILAGLVPGGESIVGLEAFKAMMPEMPKVMDVKKFEPANWVGVGNNVFFTVDWEFVHLPTGKTVSTTATVRKVIRDGKICEKYHRINVEAITKAVTPAHRVTVCPIVPGSLKDIVAAFDTAEFKQMIAGKGIVSVEAVELAEDKMLVRSVWESAEAQKEADALVAQVIGSVLKPHIAGKPDAKQGAQVWTYKGPGDASKTCHSRATIIPLKPNSLGKVLAVVDDASFLEALATLSPEFVGVSVFHTCDDVLVTYSHWASTEAEQATAPKMGALFKPMAEHFAGAPTPMPGPIVWQHDLTAPPAKPCFYTVVHEFKEGQAEGWWAQMMALKPADMAAMSKKHVALGYYGHSFMPSLTQPNLINCVWQCKDTACTPEQFQAFIDGADSPAPKEVFVNTCYKVMDGAMMPSAFDFDAPPATPVPPAQSSGNMFWVYHEFKEGAAAGFWEMMGKLGPEEMAAMHAKNASLGFSNHSFQPCTPAGPVICVWESKEPMSEEQFQAFIDGPDGPGAGQVFVNTVHKCHPGGNPPSATFTAPAAEATGSDRFSASKAKASNDKRASFFRRMFRRRASSAGAPASPAA